MLLSGADIIVKSITKAKGIQKVLNKMGYDLNNTYAIGDSSNDVPMFKLCKTSEKKKIENV